MELPRVAAKAKKDDTFNGLTSRDPIFIRRSGSFTFYWMFFSCCAQARASFGRRGRNQVHYLLENSQT